MSFGTTVPIQNKSSILREIDQFLGCGPPAIEFILVEHTVKPWSIGSSLGRFGHATIRYTLPGEGIQTVMNICGLPGKDMVNFVSPEDYLFGTENFDSSCQQGGIYNRAYCGVRIEKVPAGTVEALHMYYLALQTRANIGIAKFKLAGGRTKNIWNQYRPFAVPGMEVGNCCYWTSTGLVFSGLLTRPRIFPKGVWYDLLEHFLQEDPNNVHVVYYKEVEHAHKIYPGYHTTNTISSPLQIVRNLRYYNMEKYADVIVHVPHHVQIAMLKKGQGKRPSMWLYLQHSCFVGAIAMWYIWTSTDFGFPKINNLWLRVVIACIGVALNYYLY